MKTMFKISALFILTLFFISSILSLKIVSIDIKFSQKHIQNQLTQIFMQLESSDITPLNFTQLQNSLQSIINEIKLSQDRHEEIINRMYSQCLGEDLFRKSEVKFSNETSEIGGETLSKCQKALDSANSHLPILEKAKEEYNELRSSKIQERSSKENKLLILKNELSDSNQFLNNFLYHFKNIGTNPSSGFIELKGSLITHMTKIGKLKELFDILIELNNKTQPNTSKLAQMIFNLKNNIVAEVSILSLEDKKEENNFDKLKANLDLVIENNEKMIETTKSLIISMKLCVTKQKTIVFSAINKSTRNEKLMKLADITCKDFAREFITATNIRKQQLDSIKEMTNIINQRIGQIDLLILKNLEKISTEIKNYINNNIFRKFLEYVGIVEADNIRGIALSIK